MVEQEPFDERLPAEGRELIADAEGRGIKARLIGGIAILLLLGDRFDATFERDYGDIDLICGRRDGSDLEAMLAERGWDPAAQFNALNGARRLLFHDPRSEAQVDVFVGEFSMCHELPLTESLEQPGPSLPATDLLMTKLQIIELNGKDRNDIHALLSGCEPGTEVEVEPGRIAALTARDWGLHHTFERNLELLREEVERGEVPASSLGSIEAVSAAMEAEPKSRAWKLRARIGERKRWYDLPEEVDRA